jgi:hypothetical protein
MLLMLQLAAKTWNLARTEREEPHYGGEGRAFATARFGLPEIIAVRHVGFEASAGPYVGLAPD